MLIDIAVAALLLIGAAFVLIGAVGMVRLPDFFTRLHAPTKAATLGVGALLLASLLHFVRLGDAGYRELLALGFVFLTAPISAHLLSKAARRRDDDKRR